MFHYTFSCVSLYLLACGTRLSSFAFNVPIIDQKLPFVKITETKKAKLSKNFGNRRSLNQR